MSKIENRNYKSTFILDLRETEDDVAKVTSDISEILVALGASVDTTEELGLQEFTRAADKRYSQGNYLEVYFTGAPTVPSELKEKLHLDKRVNRIFIQSN
tara:strand:- start:843 stop:1142 length:300 start_codon:yes stop_codon:yes gene_type:complete